jgi:hypothetical protein
VPLSRGGVYINQPSLTLTKPSFRRVPTGRHIYFGVNLHAGTRMASNPSSSEHLHGLAPLAVAGTQLAIVSLSETRKAAAVMKFESILVAVLLAGGTNLFARVLAQGLELALIATAIEWSTSRIRAAAKLARSRR